MTSGVKLLSGYKNIFVHSNNNFIQQYLLLCVSIGCTFLSSVPWCILWMPVCNFLCFKQNTGSFEVQYTLTHIEHIALLNSATCTDTKEKNLLRSQHYFCSMCVFMCICSRSLVILRLNPEGMWSVLRLVFSYISGPLLFMEDQRNLEYSISSS